MDFVVRIFQRALLNQTARVGNGKTQLRAGPDLIALLRSLLLLRSKTQSPLVLRMRWLVTAREQAAHEVEEDEPYGPSMISKRARYKMPVGMRGLYN